MTEFVGKTVQELANHIFPNPFISLIVKDREGNEFWYKEHLDSVIKSIHIEYEKSNSDESETYITVVI